MILRLTIKMCASITVPVGCSAEGLKSPGWIKLEEFPVDIGSPTWPQFVKARVQRWQESNPAYQVVGSFSGEIFPH